MASEQGLVSTEAEPLSTSTISHPSLTAASIESLQADATRATASLKRARESTPLSPNSAIAAQLSGELSPAKVARYDGLGSRRSPAPMTAAAAIEDERIRELAQAEDYRIEVSGASENPAYKAHTALMSASALAMSRPQDAPMLPDGLATELPAVAIPTSNTVDSETKTDISPQSATSLASLGNSNGGAPVTTSPGPMEVDSRADRAGYIPQPQAQMEERGNGTSLSYPGLVAPASTMPAPPARGMSLPNQQFTPRSPNNKKHKCPYCETEFTRHHNLKSHLLTHSQEKPYVCQTCQMRFRRLHDLKRHSKLHTGEKPHVCPKCDRKFARGDALARHSKGPGGCVSRRGSLGIADDDFEGQSQLEGDSSTMSGVVYDGVNVNEADMTEEDRRRLSLPSIKAQHVQGNPEGFAQPARTYPPQGSAAGRLYPPNVEHGSVGTNVPNANAASIPAGGAAPSMYAQAGMTESPKPLSPSGLQGHDGNINRQRSPSLTTQFQQQHFGRHQADRQTPPGFTATDARLVAAGQSGGVLGVAPAGQQPGGVHSHTSNGAGQNGGSGDSTSNNIFATDHGIWTYIHGLEESLKELSGRVFVLEQTEKGHENKITDLTNEVMTLRKQLEEKTDAAETMA